MATKVARIALAVGLLLAVAGVSYVWLQPSTLGAVAAVLLSVLLLSTGSLCAAFMSGWSYALTYEKLNAE